MLGLLLPTLAHAGLWETITDPKWWESAANGVPTEGIAISLGTVLLDLILRNMKTEKPKSILRGITVIFYGLAKLFDRLARMLDKLLGQAAELPRAPVVPFVPPDVALPIEPPLKPKDAK